MAPFGMGLTMLGLPRVQGLSLVFTHQLATASASYYHTTGCTAEHRSETPQLEVLDVIRPLPAPWKIALGDHVQRRV